VPPRESDPAAPGPPYGELADEPQPMEIK
jgi:hypothetical protein